jgi:hypothetical protein
MLRGGVVAANPVTSAMPVHLSGPSNSATFSRSSRRTAEAAAPRSGEKTSSRCDTKSRRFRPSVPPSMNTASTG